MNTFEIAFAVFAVITVSLTFQALRGMMFEDEEFNLIAGIIMVRVEIAFRAIFAAAGFLILDTGAFVAVAVGVIVADQILSRTVFKRGNEARADYLKRIAASKAKALIVG